MKSKTKTVYYCGYCKKYFLRKDSVLNHELHCTLNPGRHCKLCGCTNIFPTIAKYLVRYRWVERNGFQWVEWMDLFGNNNEPVKLEDILDDVDRCPICTLAVLRICGLHHYETGIEFDYKKALNDWWTEVNNREYMMDEQSLACGGW